MVAAESEPICNPVESLNNWTLPPEVTRTEKPEAIAGLIFRTWVVAAGKFVSKNNATCTKIAGFVPVNWNWIFEVPLLAPPPHLKLKAPLRTCVTEGAGTVPPPCTPNTFSTKADDGASFASQPAKHCLAIYAFSITLSIKSKCP